MTMTVTMTMGIDRPMPGAGASVSAGLQLRRRYAMVLRIVCGMLAVWLATAVAPAQEYRAGALEIGKVWTREIPGGAKVAAGFMTITNTGKEPDTLIGGSVPFAGKFEVHEMQMDRGLMRMRRLEPGLVIEPGQTVVLKPGSLHVMLLDVTQGPKRGKPVKGTLVFAKAGRVEVEYAVAPIGARELGNSAGKAKGGSHGGH
jgi:copper(I)-binding protein